jgi:hypothetical protein
MNYDLRTPIADLQSKITNQKPKIRRVAPQISLFIGRMQNIVSIEIFSTFRAPILRKVDKIGPYQLLKSALKTEKKTIFSSTALDGR